MRGMAKSEAKERVEELSKKKIRLEKKLKSMRYRMRSDNRKAEARRKILVGEAVLEGVRQGKISEQVLAEILDLFVVKERDREFLGLPVNKDNVS